MSNQIRDELEITMYRYLAFWLAASVIASIYLGWAAIFAWLLSAAALTTLFSVLVSSNN